MKRLELDSEDKLELYRAFIKKMKDEGYAEYVIGEELAIVVHAIREVQDV